MVDCRGLLENDGSVPAPVLEQNRFLCYIIHIGICKFFGKIDRVSLRLIVFVLHLQMLISEPQFSTWDFF